jgi:hypothetical protein
VGTSDVGGYTGDAVDDHVHSFPPTSQPNLDQASEPCRAASSSLSNVKSGRFLGIPSDWRRPTWQRFRSRVWNPDEPRLFVPRAFGWGYAVNLARLFRRQPKS